MATANYLSNVKPVVGLVGWRGMVGSVLIDRMQAEGDFDLIDPVFFSTSNAGGKAPEQARTVTTLQDAYSLEALQRCEVVITAQAATTPTTSSPSCAPPAGPATGSTPPRRCA